MQPNAINLFRDMAVSRWHQSQMPLHYLVEVAASHGAQLPLLILVSYKSELRLDSQEADNHQASLRPTWFISTVVSVLYLSTL